MSHTSINLNCYTIRIRKKNTKDQFYKTDALPDGKDLYTVINGYMTWITKNEYKNTEADRTIYMDSLTPASKERIFYGTIKKGWSGRAAEIMELGKKKKLLFKMDKNHFYTMPFYFFISVPKDTNAAIFMAESFKQFGYKDLFHESLTKYMQLHYHDLVCDMGQLCNPILFDKLLREGTLKKVTLKSFKIPTSIDTQMTDGISIEDAEMEITIKAKMGKNLFGMQEKIKSFRDNNTSMVELIKMEGVNFNKVTADISYNGSNRKLGMDDPNSFGSFYDVTSKITLNKSGHPTLKSIHKEAKDIYENDIKPLLEKL